MAGVVPMSGRSGRKQWTLHDGPRGSLGRLRSQLAEDGCPESQVVLAKQLLEERCESEVDKEENAKLGVYWLTKASEQGNLEATDILRKCLATGRGITEHNYYDVKSCLDTSRDEKLARRAAREMFTSLSNGEDYITTEQLQRRMRDLAFPDTNNRRSASAFPYDSSENEVKKILDQREVSSASPFTNARTEEDGPSLSAKEKERSTETLPDWSEHQGEKITEAALVTAAASYARGSLPIVSRAVCLLEPSQISLETIPLLQRPLLYPVASLKRLYVWLIESLGKRGTPILDKIFSPNVRILILLAFYSLFGTESLILFVPISLYYLSFVVMVIATFQMLHRRRELTDFRIWSGLFLSYSGGNLNPEEAEYQYSRNNLKPYGHYFLALLTNLVVYPAIAHQWTPQSEFTIIAFVLTLTTLFNFTWKDATSRFPDTLALFSFGVHVLAKYPYETDIVVGQRWRFLDVRVPTFASYVVGNGIEFCLNFRAVFYLFIPAVFLKMATRDGFRGTYKTLIPHCVTLSWWQIAILCSQGATWYGLIRGALAIVGMVLFLPIAGLASIVLPIIAAAKYLPDNDLLTKSLITSLLAGLPFVVSWYVKKNRTHRYNGVITFIQITLGIAAGTWLGWSMFNEHNGTEENGPDYEDTRATLSWEQYQNYCHQPAWVESSSFARVQVECATNLEGISIAWEGYVTKVKLRSLKNNVGDILNKFPDAIRIPLTCMYGEPITNGANDCSTREESRREACQFFDSIEKRRNKCSLKSWDRYEFEIYVKMKSGIWGTHGELVLIADHSFANFSLNIYSGDKIWFVGTLLNSDFSSDFMLGGNQPRVELKEVGCHVCHATYLKSFKQYRYEITPSSILRDTYLGIKSVLNFLLNPLVIFK